jgi:4-hydroxybenzoate polyprenyltransferase
VTIRAESVASHVLWPGPGYIGRMRVYLRAMFPLRLHGALALLLYANLAWLFHRQFPEQAGSIRAAALALFSMLALDLLIRMMDEIKDKELDVRFHPTRPLPAGAVTEADLRCSQLIVAGLFLGAAALSPGTFGGAVGLLVYSVALSRHLFMRPLLERSPLMTLLTHSPCVPLLLLYVAAMGLAGRALSLADIPQIPLLLSVGAAWFLTVTVEIARKTRAPQCEDGYPTYSAAWGANRAVLAALAAATTALLASGVLARMAAHSMLVLVPCIGGYLWFAAAAGQALRSSGRERLRLVAAAHAYAALTLLAFPLEGWVSP